MSRFLAYLLTVVLLFQTLGQELLVLEYAVNKTAITQRYCVNKARPRLHCDGKCYLAKKLRRAASQESKAPESGFAKLKLEALLPLRLRLRRPALHTWPTATPRYQRLTVPAYAGAPLRGVFQPPAFRG